MLGAMSSNLERDFLCGIANIKINFKTKNYDDKNFRKNI
jgi:hypothetical protein